MACGVGKWERALTCEHCLELEDPRFECEHNASWQAKLDETARRRVAETAPAAAAAAAAAATAATAAAALAKRRRDCPTALRIRLVVGALEYGE